MKRIGIYAGTFDPIHNGHIEFATAALKFGNLDEVIFLPERTPRHKHGLTSYEHRLLLIKQAIADTPEMHAKQLADDHFTVKTTLPELTSAYPGATLVFLVGSDVVTYMPSWEGVDELFNESELIVGVREGTTLKAIEEAIQAWPTKPRTFFALQGMQYRNISSTNIRQKLQVGMASSDVPASVGHYIKNHNLYR